jgi:hypothetical protein
LKNQIISCVDYFSKSKLVYCHIYSYPYTWTSYDNITNSFPGRLFKCVREISLHDEHPFEHAFFLRIAQSSPFIEKLSLDNHEQQQNDNQQCSIIKYYHLIDTHENYVEQFLNDTKMCVLNNVHVRVTYNCLQNVTNDFTRDATRVNGSTVIGLVLDYTPKLQKLKNYFVHAEIYRLL